MLSVITCSNKPLQGSVHEQHINGTIGCGHEYIRIDNSNNEMGICAAYNKGVSKAQGDIFVFVHDDVFFINRGWGPLLVDKFYRNTTVGLIGVAGTQYLFAENPAWIIAGRPFIKGWVVNKIEVDKLPVVSMFSESKGADSEVVAVDGLFFAIRAELFKRIAFDEHSFDRFHFYDLDICMQVRKSHKIVVTHDIFIKHLSPGSFDNNWATYRNRFKEKYASLLPVSCTQRIPDLTARIAHESIPIQEISSPETLNYIISLGEENGSGQQDQIGRDTLQRNALDKDLPDYYNRINPDILEKIPFNALRVLEIGCGAGALAAAYKRVNGGVEYYGIELSEAAAKYAMYYGRVDKIAVGNVEEMDLDELGVQTDSLDCIIYGDLLEHLVDPWKLLKRHVNFLKANGLIIACIPNIGHWTTIQKLVYGVWEYEQEGLIDRSHLRFFTISTITDLFEKAGLEIFDIKKRDFFNEYYGEFLNAFSCFLKKVNINEEEFTNRATAYQYVVCAKRKI